MADPSSIYGGYLKASRYSRIKDTDLEKALKPYAITLASVRSNRRTPDSALRKQAVSAVVKRYQKRKK